MVPMTTVETPSGSAPAPVRWERLQPGIRTVWRIGGMTSAAVLAAAAAIAAQFLDRARPLPVAPWVLGVVLLPILAGYFFWYAGRRFEAFRYALTPVDLGVRHGVFWHLSRTVPRVRIQHVDVHSGPLDRALGLAQVSIYTAGSAGAVETIPGLDPAAAEALRDALLGLSPRP